MFHLSDWLEAVQAFAFLGVVTLIIALVLVIIVLFMKDVKVLKLIVWILAFVAGRFIATYLFVFQTGWRPFRHFLSLVSWL